jgi:hypothetical protein
MGGGDVTFHKAAAYPGPYDFELRFAIFEIDAVPAVAAERWLAVDVTAPVISRGSPLPLERTSWDLDDRSSIDQAGAKAHPRHGSCPLEWRH